MYKSPHFENIFFHPPSPPCLRRRPTPRHSRLSPAAHAWVGGMGGWHGWVAWVGGMGSMVPSYAVAAKAVQDSKATPERAFEF